MFVVAFNDKAKVEPLGGNAFTSIPNELENEVGPLSAVGRIRCKN